MIIVNKIRATEVVIITIRNIFVIEIDRIPINIFSILSITRRWITKILAMFKFIELFECLAMKIFYNLFQFSNFVFQFINR